MKRPLAVAALVAVVTCGEACRSTPTAPTEASIAAALPGRIDSASYTFRFADGDTVDAARQERVHAWAVAALGIATPPRIEYFKYRDRAHLQRVTGRVTNGFAEAERLRLHTIWPWDPHEAVHVLTIAVGRPSDFWNEGLATAFSVDPDNLARGALWQGRTVHQWVREYAASGRVRPLSTIVESNAFRSYDEALGYPVAGSFVDYLIARDGMTAVLALFRGASRNDSLSVQATRFTQAFGRSLDDADWQWREWLNASPDLR